MVDDASHLYFETRESFRVLFPRLRPGGLYVIEDWGWAHWSGEYWQEQNGGDFFRGNPPLSNLLIEINGVVAFIERGPDPIDADFELSDHYRNRGDNIPFLGPGLVDPIDSRP